MKSEAEPSLYSIKPLVPEALADWFLFGGIDTPENRQKLTAILSSAPKVKRFVVYDQDRALGRFAVEPTQTGLTSWCPRLLPDLPTAHTLKLMNEAAHWLTQRVHQEKRAFAECMIQHGLPQQQMWQAALLNQGFQVISTKHQWVFEESDAKSAPAGHEPVSHLQRLSTKTSPALEAAYINTASGSLDKALVIETRGGEGLGDFDFVLTKQDDQQNILGLCVCEHHITTGSAWIKYLGICPQARQNGHASTLLAAALREFKNRQVSKIYSLTDAENTPSINTHIKLGFRQTEISFSTLYYVP